MLAPCDGVGRGPAEASAEELGLTGLAEDEEAVEGLAWDGNKPCSITLAMAWQKPCDGIAACHHWWVNRNGWRSFPCALSQL